MEFSGLGFELAQLHSSLESTDNMQNRLVQSKLWDRVLRRQQILAKQLELTDAVLSQLTCCQGGGGDTLLQAPAMSFAHEVFDEVSVKNDVASQDEHVGFMSSMMWKGPAEERSNEMSIADVVWDETVQDMVDQHGLLQQLAQGSEYLDADEWKPNVEFSPVSEANNIASAVIDYMHHKDTIWDDELEQYHGSQGGLLQLFAGDGEIPDLEKPEQAMDELLNNNDSWTSGLALGLDAKYGVFDKVQQGGEYLIGKEKKATAESSHTNGVSFSMELDNDSVLLDEQYHTDVIWDEDLSSDLDYSCGLLRDQLYCVNAREGDKTNLVYEQVTQSMLFETNSPSPVQDLVVVDAAKVFADRPFRDDASACADQVTFIAPEASKDAACEALNDLYRFDWPIFGEMPTVNVFLDEELKDGIGSHDGLLQLVADARYRKSKETIGTIVDHSFLPQVLGLADKDQAADEMHRKDKRAKMLLQESNWMKRHTCKMLEAQAILFLNKHSLYKVTASIRRQWDPSIMKLHMRQWFGCDPKCCNGSYSSTECDGAMCKQFLYTTTAWGQAVFWGGGNVMTRVWIKRSLLLPKPIYSSQPNSQGNSTKQRRQHHRGVSNNSENRERNRRSSSSFHPTEILPLSISL